MDVTCPVDAKLENLKVKLKMVMFFFFSPSVEEDLLDSKAHTYPRRRSHTIGSSNVDYNDGMKMKDVVTQSRNQHLFQLCLSSLTKPGCWLVVDGASRFEPRQCQYMLCRYGEIYYPKAYSVSLHMGV